METNDEPTLTQFNLKSPEVNSAWASLPPRQQAWLIPDYRLLYSNALLDDEIALLLIHNPYYSSYLAELLIQLHSMGETLPAHLNVLSTQSTVAKGLEALLKKLVALGCVMNTDCINHVLSLRQVDAFSALIDFWHEQGVFNQEFMENFLEKKIISIGDFVDCLKLLSEWHLYSNSNETLLSTIADEHLSDVLSSLRLLDSGCIISQELWLELVEHQSSAKPIAQGLNILDSRVPLPFERLHALTVIHATDAADSVAGSLSFLIKCGLDSEDNCKALIRTKAYSKPIEIVLFQLTRQHGATPENIHAIFQVASLLMEPILLRKLQCIPFFSPVPPSHFNEMFRLLGTLASETPSTEEKNSILEECANLIEHRTKLGGGPPGDHALQYTMPSP